jgi:hypothetical protein
MNISVSTRALKSKKLALNSWSHKLFRLASISLLPSQECVLRAAAHKNKHLLIQEMRFIICHDFVYVVCTNEDLHSYGG